MLVASSSQLSNGRDQARYSLRSAGRPRANPTFLPRHDVHFRDVNPAGMERMEYRRPPSGLVENYHLVTIPGVCRH